MLSQMFWLLGGIGTPKPCVTDFRAPRGPLVFTKSCVFTGVRAPPGRWGLQNFMFPAVFWLLGAPGGSKIMCFHKLFGSSGDLGDPKPLCFHRCSGSSGTPEGSKNFVFTGVRAPREPWGSKTLFVHKVSGSSGRLGAPVFSHLFCPSGALGSLCVFINVLAPGVPWGAPKPFVFTGFRALRGSWELQNPMFSQVFWLLRGAWGLQTLCFQRFLARLGPGELPNR